MPHFPLLLSERFKKSIPEWMEHIEHSYDDLYGIIEQITEILISLAFSSLSASCFTSDHWLTLFEWHKKELPITLRFIAKVECTFLKTISKSSYTQTNHEISLGVRSFLSGYTRDNIKEFHWKNTCNFELIAFPSGEEDQKIIFLSAAQQKLFITTDPTYKSKPIIYEPTDIQFHPFLALFEENGKMKKISLSRSLNGSTLSPVHNKDVSDMNDLFQSFSGWTEAVWSRLSTTVPATFPTASIPIPVALKINTDGKNFVYYSVEEIKSLLAEYEENTTERIILTAKHSYEASQGSTIRSYPLKKDTIRLRGLVDMFKGTAKEFQEKVSFIDSLMRKALVDTLGRYITPNDVTECMNYQYRTLLRSEFQPKPFCYPILSHSPENDTEGTISIKTPGSMVSNVPVFTKELGKGAVTMNLSASIQIALSCHSFAHAWVLHDFSTKEANRRTNDIQLVARAKRFSGFIVLLGSVLSQGTMDCQHAFVIQENEEYLIPLLVESLPTAKAFKAAISSLSKEQQAFANAYRAMQLAGTLFVVASIPIQEQVERILNLPEFSLTKEITLHNHILDLLVTYQIPSDLFATSDDVPHSKKVNQVRRHVDALLCMIQEERDDILAEEKRKAEYERMQVAISENKEKQIVGFLVASLISLVDSPSLYGLEKVVVVNGDVSNVLRTTASSLRVPYAKEQKSLRNSILAPGYAIHQMTLAGKVCLCLTGQDHPAREAFNFLSSLHKCPGFVSSYTQTFLSLYIKKSKQSEVQIEIEEVQRIMMENIDKLIDRSECIERLESKADTLTAQSSVFKASSSRTSRFKLPSFRPALFSSPVPVHKGMPDPWLDSFDLKSEDKVVDIDEVIMDCLDKKEEKKEFGDDGNHEEEEAKMEEGEKEIEEEKDSPPPPPPLPPFSLGIDVTAIPKKLDAAFELHDADDAIHSTSIKVSKEWVKKSSSLLGKEMFIEINTAEKQAEEKKTALDLLDALSSSGNSPLTGVNVHYMLGVSHWFDLCIDDSLIEKNINPIAKLEKTGFLVSTILHGVTCEDIVKEEKKEEVAQNHPALFK